MRRGQSEERAFVPLRAVITTCEGTILMLMEEKGNGGGSRRTLFWTVI